MISTQFPAGPRFIHQGEERVRRVGADRREDAGDETGRARDAELLARRHLRGLGAQAAVDSVGNFILHDELGDRVPVRRLFGRGDLLRRACVLSEFLSLQLGGLKS